MHFGFMGVLSILLLQNYASSCTCRRPLKIITFKNRWVLRYGDTEIRQVNITANYYTEP